MIDSLIGVAKETLLDGFSPMEGFTVEMQKFK
jgi:hypothetical protein